MIDDIVLRAKSALEAKDLATAIVGRRVIELAIVRGLYGAGARHVEIHQQIYDGIGELIRSNLRE